MAEDTNRGADGRFLRSGNPEGRPRGSKNVKTIVHEIASTVRILKIDADTQKRMTNYEAVLHALRHAAVMGDRRAGKLFRERIQRNEPVPPSGEYGVLVAPAAISAEEWIKRAIEENKTKKKPG